MFVDEKAVGEPQTAEQSNRKLKLSEAIRIGSKISRPTHDLGPGYLAWVCWRSDKCFSCAVGAAWLGAHGNDKDKFYQDFGTLSSVARDFGVARGFLEEKLQWPYEQGDMTREQIADMLEAQGY